MPYMFIRSLAMTAIGILLLMLREQAMPFIVMCVGMLFMLPAIFALAVVLIPFFKRAGNSKSAAIIVPVISLGSFFLGLWMFLQPDFFVAILMWVLGGVMVAMGLFLTVNLIVALRHTSVSIFLFVLPVAIAVAGVVVLFNPFEAASVPFVILGVAAIISAMSDMLNTFYLKVAMKRCKENESGSSAVEILDEQEQS